MTEHPQKGGRYLRHPETGELKPEADMPTENAAADETPPNKAQGTKSRRKTQ